MVFNLAKNLFSSLYWSLPIAVEIPSSWLLKKVSVKEVEEAESQFPDRPEIHGLPFGFCNLEWRRLLERMRDGDELWEFRSPQSSWENDHGRAGYVVVRDRRVIAHIITEMN